MKIVVICIPVLLVLVGFLAIDHWLKSEKTASVEMKLTSLFIKFQLKIRKTTTNKDDEAKTNNTL